jgi:hypothetical protein
MFAGRCRRCGGAGDARDREGACSRGSGSPSSARGALKGRGGAHMRAVCGARRGCTLRGASGPSGRGGGGTHRSGRGSTHDPGGRSRTWSCDRDRGTVERSDRAEAHGELHARGRRRAPESGAAVKREPGRFRWGDVGASSCARHGGRRSGCGAHPARERSRGAGSGGSRACGGRGRSRSDPRARGAQDLGRLGGRERGGSEPKGRGRKLESRTPHARERPGSLDRSSGEPAAAAAHDPGWIGRPKRGDRRGRHRHPGTGQHPSPWGSGAGEPLGLGRFGCAEILRIPRRGDRSGGHRHPRAGESARGRRGGPSRRRRRGGGADVRLRGAPDGDGGSGRRQARAGGGPSGGGRGARDLSGGGRADVRRGGRGRDRRRIGGTLDRGSPGGGRSVRGRFTTNPGHRGREEGVGSAQPAAADAVGRSEARAGGERAGDGRRACSLGGECGSLQNAGDGCGRRRSGEDRAGDRSRGERCRVVGGGSRGRGGCESREGASRRRRLWGRRGRPREACEDSGCRGDRARYRVGGGRRRGHSGARATRDGSRGWCWRCRRPGDGRRRSGGHIGLGDDGGLRGPLDAGPGSFHRGFDGRRCGGEARQRREREARACAREAESMGGDGAGAGGGPDGCRRCGFGSGEGTRDPGRRIGPTGGVCGAAHGSGDGSAGHGGCLLRGDRSGGRGGRATGSRDGDIGPDIPRVRSLGGGRRGSRSRASGACEDRGGLGCGGGGGGRREGPRRPHRLASDRGGGRCRPVQSAREGPRRERLSGHHGGGIRCGGLDRRGEWACRAERALGRCRSGGGGGESDGRGGGDREAGRRAQEWATVGSVGGDGALDGLRSTQAEAPSGHPRQRLLRRGGGGPCERSALEGCIGG